MFNASFKEVGIVFSDAFKILKMSEKKTPFFERFSNSVTQATGTSIAFGIAVILILAWAATGPFFHFSETWQLVINTGTTIVTFLMVFLIQKSQNKDSKAIQLKLNELIASVKGASNRLVNIEDLNEEELDQLHKLYIRLSAQAKKTHDIKASQSIETAIEDIGDKMENIEEKVDDISEKMEDISDKMDDESGKF